MRKLYFVTTIKKKSEGSRCIGYYLKLSQARAVITRNCESLHEAGWYQWAVIEVFGPGWYPNSYFEEWYKLHKNKATKINKPETFKYISGFGIG